VIPIILIIMLNCSGTKKLVSRHIKVASKELMGQVYPVEEGVKVKYLFLNLP
jgi:hypothetical protein